MPRPARRLARPARRRGRHVVPTGLAAVAMLVLAGCGGASDAPSVGTTPDQAEPLLERGAWTLDLQNCENSIMLGLGSKGVAVQEYRIPAETPWPTVLDFYAGRLGDGWTLKSKDVDAGRCRYQAWTKGRLVGADRYFAVATLTDPVTGADGRTFRALTLLRTE